MKKGEDDHLRNVTFIAGSQPPNEAMRRRIKLRSTERARIDQGSMDQDRSVEEGSARKRKLDEMCHEFPPRQRWKPAASNIPSKDHANATPRLSRESLRDGLHKQIIENRIRDATNSREVDCKRVQKLSVHQVGHARGSVISKGQLTSTTGKHEHEAIARIMCASKSSSKG